MKRDWQWDYLPRTQELEHIPWKHLAEYAFLYNMGFYRLHTNIWKLFTYFFLVILAICLILTRLFFFIVFSPGRNWSTKKFNLSKSVIEMRALFPSPSTSRGITHPIPPSGSTVSLPYKRENYCNWNSHKSIIANVVSFLDMCVCVWRCVHMCVGTSFVSVTFYSEVLS